MKNALYALSQGEPVGTVTYVFGDKIKARHIARIFAVYVDPAYRGKGIGKRLLKRALELIQANKKIVKVQLMVNCEQRAALNLYKSVGFNAVGLLKKETKVRGRFYDELIMEKML